MSTMKCQHCGSDDIVTIQGQNYCLNCGETVLAPTPKPEPAPVPVQTPVAVAVEPVVTPPPKPKADPVVVNPAKKSASVVAPPAVPSISKFGGAPVVAVASKAASSSPTPSPASTETVVPIVTKPPVKVPKKRAPRASAKSVKKKVAPKTEQPVAVKVAKTPQRKPIAAALGGKPSGKLSKPKLAADPLKNQEPKVAHQVHPLKFSLRVTSGLALATGLAIGLSFWLKVDAGIALYLAASGIVAFLIVLTLAQSALLYGFSRSYDGRPATHQLWWAAARSGFLDIVNINLATVISVFFIIAVNLLGWRLVNQYATGTLGWSALGALNLLSVWLLLGSYVAKRIAVPAVIVGGVSSTEALELGWRFFWKAGGHLVAAALEVLLIRVMALTLVCITAFTALSTISATSDVVIAVASGATVALACFLFGMSLLELELRVWLRQYRQWATMLPPDKQTQLTTGRMQLHQSSQS